MISIFQVPKMIKRGPEPLEHVAAAVDYTLQWVLYKPHYD